MSPTQLTFDFTAPTEQPLPEPTYITTMRVQQTIRLLKAGHTFPDHEPCPVIPFQRRQRPDSATAA